MKTFQIFKPILLIGISCLFFTAAKSQEKEEEKITASTKTLEDFGKMKESIPAEMLKVTEGIIIVPKLINGGFVLAGKRGKGLAMVKFENGTWSNPVFVTITGGSVGLQAGVESIELILIFKNRETLEKIGKGSFTLGGDVSATAGPVGRSSSAGTDYKLEAEVYSYSRSKGLFGGISLNGSVIDIDEDANKDFYGTEIDSKTLFSNSAKTDAASVTQMKSALKSLYK